VQRFDKYDSGFEGLAVRPFRGYPLTRVVSECTQSGIDSSRRANIED